MFARTPVKKSQPTSQTTPEMEKAGPSNRGDVRRSIGEWEASSDSSAVPSSNTTMTLSPPPRFRSRTAEAEDCSKEAIKLLNISRNLKTEIKTGITKKLNRLALLVREAEAQSRGHKQTKKAETAEIGIQTEITGEQIDTDERWTVQEQVVLMNKLLLEMENQNEEIMELKSRTQDLTSAVEHLPEPVDRTKEILDKILVLKNGIRKVVENIADPEEFTTPILASISELKGGLNNIVVEHKPDPQDKTPEILASISELRSDLNARVLPQPTYAEALTRQKPSIPTPKHTIIVTSDNDEDTSGELITKIREAVDAKNSGIRIDRLRKARDQKVILSCESKDEIKRVAEAVKKKNLGVKEAPNKDPLVVVKDVLAIHSEEELIGAIRTQNKHLLSGIDEENIRLKLKYKRKARNPHAAHVVLQVSPQVWQCLTTAGRVHIDLQRVRVEDQSPLVQCSMCLGYGHTRRLCTETQEKCSHCGGTHPGAECAERLLRQAPVCCNCSRAKLIETNHNAFDQACPIRKKWDALARAATAYC